MSDFDLPIAAMDRKRHRRAVWELVNRERVVHGRRRLRFAPSLSLSARSWARALSSDSRFTHGDFARRVLRFPFVLRSAGRWKVAENLGWGTGSESTPRSIVSRWMASPEHRANILGTWRYSAVWTQRDAPSPGLQPNSVIVVQHFGRRG
ncbi:MAG: hypothetical protein QOG77_3242 [Solirubrobacteraceae bacterium]|jgi:uncharacterized protein YkwD|nr:hypothetical protein [Solirubrobacteraceae bacterium]